MVKAQEYIENKYPWTIQKQLKKLDISNQSLEGVLDLGEFVELEELNCSSNCLTKLNLFSCKNLKKINCDNNADGFIIVWRETIRKQVEKYSREERENKRRRRQGQIIPAKSLTWSNLHKDFTFELTQNWKGLGFTIEQTREWINVGFKPHNYEFCTWLRDVKKADAESILNYADKRVLSQEFFLYQQQQLTTQIEQLLK